MWKFQLKCFFVCLFIPLLCPFRGCVEPIHNNTHKSPTQKTFRPQAWKSRVVMELSPIWVSPPLTPFNLPSSSALLPFYDRFDRTGVSTSTHPTPIRGGGWSHCDSHACVKPLQPGHVGPLQEVGDSNQSVWHKHVPDLVWTAVKKYVCLNKEHGVVVAIITF